MAEVYNAFSGQYVEETFGGHHFQMGARFKYSHSLVEGREVKEIRAIAPGYLQSYLVGVFLLLLQRNQYLHIPRP